MCGQRQTYLTKKAGSVQHRDVPVLKSKGNFGSQRQNFVTIPTYWKAPGSSAFLVRGFASAAQAGAVFPTRIQAALSRTHGVSIAL
jgi:hypothetical protein